MWVGYRVPLTCYEAYHVTISHDFMNKVVFEQYHEMMKTLHYEVGKGKVTFGGCYSYIAFALKL